MEQFLRDHGTGAVPEHYYDQYVAGLDRPPARGARRRDAAERCRRPGIALIGTLDTKGDEIAYVRDRLRALGARPLVIDSGILGEADGCVADVAARGGRRARAATTLDGVRAAGSRGAAVALMLEGVRAVVPARCTPRAASHGVLCLGGAEGALLGAAAMHALPVGVPKLIVSPSASGRRAFGAVRGRERRDGHALGGRHPRPATRSRARSSTTRRRRSRAWCATAGGAVGDLGERCVGITMLGQTTPGVMRAARAAASRPGTSR